MQIIHVPFDLYIVCFCRKKTARKRPKRVVFLLTVSFFFLLSLVQSLRAAMAQRHSVRLRQTAAVRSTALRNTVEMVYQSKGQCMNNSLNLTLFRARRFLRMYAQWRLLSAWAA